MNGKDFISKSVIVRDAVKCKDYRKALRIAKDFRLGIDPEDRKTMRRAYEVMVHPVFFQTLYMDLEAEVRKGIEVIERLYGGRRND